MERAGSIKFTDLSTANEFWAGVRYGDTRVALSVVNNWDRVGPSERREIEILMKREDAGALLNALRSAIEGEPPAMREVAAIAFADLDTGEQTSITVRHDATSVGLYLCNEDDGEVQVAMRREDARALLEVLQTAVGGSRD